MNEATQRSPAERSSVWEVLAVFLRLGLTSFGGPVAHLGYFRDAFVLRKRWLDEQGFGDLVALSQFLPGPASSQVGIAVGASRAGFAGALAAWAGFTLPSAIALILFAAGVERFAGANAAGWLAGLRVVTVAVVARATWGMARTLCPDVPRATLAVAATLVVLAISGPAGQIAAIALGALVGGFAFRVDAPGSPRPLSLAVGRRAGGWLLVVFALLLAGLPLAAGASGVLGVLLFDSFYRSGSLLFGGGHVILPLLQAQVVPPGWIDNDGFLAGYGAAQAVPGPLLAFSAYLGAIMDPRLGGWPMGFLCLVAVFLPSFLLVLGAMPFWDALRRRAGMRAAMQGINAAVVGLLAAALYDPIWTGGIRAPADIALAGAAFVLLGFRRLPPWSVVVFCAGAGALLAGV